MFGLWSRISKLNKLGRRESKISTIGAFNSLVLPPGYAIERLDSRNIENIADKVLSAYWHFVLNSNGFILDRQKIENLSPEKESEAQEVLKQMSLKFKDFVSNRRDIEPELFFSTLISAIKDFVSFKGDYYYDFGFTPKISSVGLGVNCFGFVQILGKVLMDAGLEVKMAKAVNHPFCLVQEGGKVFFISLYGVQSMSLEEYEKYRPTKIGQNENGSDITLLNLRNRVKTEEFNMDEKIFIITDFKYAVVYFILENIQAYANLINGKPVMGLPVLDRPDTKPTWEDLRPYLDSANWYALQSRIFSGLHKARESVRSLFDDEYKAMLDTYDEIEVSNRLSGIFTHINHILFIDSHGESEHRLDLFNEFVSERDKKNREYFTLYANEIVEYVKQGVLSENMPNGLKSFVDSVMYYISYESDIDLQTKLKERFLERAYRQIGREAEIEAKQNFIIPEKFKALKTIIEGTKDE